MQTVKLILKWVLGVGMIFAGVNHFLNPDFYMKIMPPYLPWYLFLVYLSGVFEIILGAMLLIPKAQKLTAWAFDSQGKSKNLPTNLYE